MFKNIFAIGFFLSVASTYAQDLQDTSIERSETVIIKSYKRSRSENAMMNEVKTAGLTMNGISGELIKKIQVTSANDVVKRVSGISIFGDKYIVVRGISPRYNVTWLNGFSAPSFNPDNKIFSYDILPASVIDNIKLYKTASSELPADFGGGMVKVETISLPEKSDWVVSFGTGLDMNTTFHDFKRQNQPSPSYFGLKSKPNDVPNGLIGVAMDKDYISLTDRIKYTNLMQDNFEPIVNKLNTPNWNFAIDKKIRKKYKNFIYGSNHLLSLRDDYSQNQFRRGSIMTVPEKMRVINFSDESSVNEKTITFLNNFTIGFNSGWRMDLKTLYVNLAQFGVVERRGTSLPNAYGENGIYANTSFIQDIIYNVYRNFFNGYFGVSKSKDKSNFIFSIGTTLSNYKDLDRKSNLKLRNDDPSGTNTTQTFAASYVNTMDQLRYGRWFFYLPEKTVNANVNYSYQLNRKNKLMLGGLLERTDRSFKLRSMGMVKKEWPGDSITPTKTLNLLSEYTWPYNSYSANSFKEVIYVNYNYSSKKINFNGGVRMENFHYNLNSEGFKTYIGSDYLGLKSLKFFPSFNGNYKFDSKNQLRFSAGLSCNRPEFRELSPFQYLDIENWVTAYGSAKLSPITMIKNTDIRFEKYSKGLVLQFGGFYKQFINPIITRIIAPNTFVYSNAAQGENFGFEAELRLTFKEIRNFQSGLLSNFSLIANGMVNKSNMWDYSIVGDFNSSKKDMNQSMIGQSPYTANLMLFYDIKKINGSLSITYFKQGDRSVFIGDNFAMFSMYEKTGSNLDIVFECKLSPLVKLRLRGANLLNNRNLIYQDLNQNHKLDFYDGYKTSIEGDNIFKSSYNISAFSTTIVWNFK